MASQIHEDILNVAFRGHVIAPQPGAVSSPRGGWKPVQPEASSRPNSRER